MNRLLLSALLVNIFFCSFSQIDVEKLVYAHQYGNIAINKMKEYGIPASITLAQGILESLCGKSPLAINSNNHFGIKCHKEWTGDTYYYDDDSLQECFRKYDNVEDSFNDHSLFLITRQRYAFLFSYDNADYSSWAKGLKKAGYATNPKYAELLIKIIEDNKLYLYDSCALGLINSINLLQDNETIVDSLFLERNIFEQFDTLQNR